MIRLVFLLFCVGVISGCSTVTDKNTKNSFSKTDELFLEQSENYTSLVEIYKSRLKKEESSEVRLKLAEAYIKLNDNDSALFILTPVILSKNSSSQAFYLQGLAQYNLGKIVEASHSLEISVNKQKTNAKAINLLGVVLAESGKLQKARQRFSEARALMYDDYTIKNNLALVDMLEGKYQEAASKLMPIYLHRADQTDARLKANLAIVVSKLGSFDTLRSLYGHEFTDAQLFDIYQGLRSSIPIKGDSAQALPSVNSMHKAMNSNQGPRALVETALVPQEIKTLPKQMKSSSMEAEGSEKKEEVLESSFSNNEQESVLTSEAVNKESFFKPFSSGKARNKVQEGLSIHKEPSLQELAKLSRSGSKVTKTSPRKEILHKVQEMQKESSRIVGAVPATDSESAAFESLQADQYSVDSGAPVTNIDIQPIAKVNKRSIINSKVSEVTSDASLYEPLVERPLPIAVASTKAKGHDRIVKHQFVSLHDYYLVSNHSVAIPIAPFRLKSEN